MEVFSGSPPGNFQSSLRDFSSFEFLPRTASWAKFSRPCGTHFAIGSTRGLQPLRFAFGDIHEQNYTPGAEAVSFVSCLPQKQTHRRSIHLDIQPELFDAFPAMLFQVRQQSFIRQVERVGVLPVMVNDIM